MPKNIEFKIREANVIEGIEFGQRTYKTYGPVNYYMPGVASALEKKKLNDWLKKTKGDGDPPLPWKYGYRSAYAGICIDEFPDEDIVKEEEVPNIQTLTEEDIARIVEPIPGVEPPTAPVLPRPEPVIHSIKSVPDDRRRTGYRSYPRL